MTTKNNDSRMKCKEISVLRNWKKDKNRNVIEVDGEKWSFSVFQDYPECRQTYNDTVGFIGLNAKTGCLGKYRIRDLTTRKLSRISPSGIKAYNVILNRDAIADYI